MKVAQAKLKEIGPDDMNMEEYKKWHEDYSLFRKVSVYLLTGLELYQKGKYVGLSFHTGYWSAHSRSRGPACDAAGSQPGTTQSPLDLCSSQDCTFALHTTHVLFSLCLVDLLVKRHTVAGVSDNKDEPRK